ncbi:MAG: L,D-transpeptidase [Clostridia bacterium]|jgi:lipoprotein-anchoring transpeptidase ErfK/SrfK|nr:L,D-transpeptidase [Clostridia bacterium]
MNKKNARRITLLLLLMFITYAIISQKGKVNHRDENNKIVTDVTFNLPMNTEEKVDLIVEANVEKISYSSEWIDDRVLEIEIDKPTSVENELVKLSAKNIKTKIPLVTKEFEKVIRIKEDARIDVIRINPVIGSEEVRIDSKIIIEMDEEIEAAYMYGLEGETKIEGKVITFKPNNLLKDNKDYNVKVAIVPVSKKQSRLININFKTEDIESKKIVEILKDEGVLKVYEDGEIVKLYKASVGLPEFETPEGRFKLTDRGASFYSKKYGQGAKYWVRIVGNYLIHGYARDKEGNILEKNKIGEPASHGCIRLDDENAKWIYNNVERNTFTIIR